MFTKTDISRYYDLSEVHYRIFWDLEKSLSLHYGYWDETTKTLQDALQNVNRVLADFAGIKEGDVVLDAGCGVGGSSIWLAKNRNCNVTGITLNAKQVRKATAFAEQDGVADHAKFEQNDYTNTGYPSESFDIVWAIESVCHADDKSAFLREAYRLLKKGGRLIMVDTFKLPGIQGKDAAEVKALANGWAINDFVTMAEFQQKMNEAGFRNITTRDASQAIMPSAKRLYRTYFIGKPFSFLYNLFHPNVTTLAKNNVETAYLIYKTLKRGLWKYEIVRAVK